jgi:hypothetical protein
MHGPNCIQICTIIIIIIIIRRFGTKFTSEHLRGSTPRVPSATGRLDGQITEGPTANWRNPLTRPFTAINDRLWWFPGAILILAGTKYALYKKEATMVNARVLLRNIGADRQTGKP